ncbi:TetR/AcrR family transcriptional regulator [Catellatospora bangladeshensis]|uniref:TetR/AcrR family transcriptional regulator n=1 Tax=Catellatospora bangladeshensis TaxID=310355 RepID=UPI00361D707C
MRYDGRHSQGDGHDDRYAGQDGAHRRAAAGRARLRRDVLPGRHRPVRAPRGSIYHHFPGGKEQLAAEALRWYAGRNRVQVGGDAPGGRALDAVAGYFAAMASWLRKTDFKGGCPIAGVALDVGPDEPLHAVVAAAFADWRGVLEHAFQAEGCAPGTARALGALVIAAAEGALLLARAERDLTAYQDVAAEVLWHLRTTLAAAAGEPAASAVR